MLGEQTPEFGDLYYPYSQASACGTALPQSKYPSGCGTCPTGQICDAEGTGCTLDWGSQNECIPDATNADDAVFNVDQLFGYGPESVTHQQPFDGTYKVTAVYYAYDSCSSPMGSGATTAEINIYLSGSLAWHGSMPGMQACDAWDAADIVVSSGSTMVNPLTAPVYNVSNLSGVCGG